MSTSAARRAVVSLPRPGAPAVRVAFIGSPAWLSSCAPTVDVHGMSFRSYSTATQDASERLAAFDADVAVLFDPSGIDAEVLSCAGTVRLGVIVGELPAVADGALDAFERLVSFRPAQTGERVGARQVWRAIPPPVCDSFYKAVRPLHGHPRAMTVGRSTERREEMLLPAKHHHDVLQVLHGVLGEELVELLDEHDVGIHVGDGQGFGPQVGMHLAAGHLLLSDELIPAHGLERNIDFLQVESAEAIVWTLERLARFPEMHQRVRVRGRLKAEQYRASRLFARVVWDLLADVAAFGRRG